MTAVMIVWTVAMLAGLWGPRWVTGLLTAATLVLWIATQPVRWGDWAMWAQLAILSLGPWGLATQRRRDMHTFERLRAEERDEQGRLAEAARSLLSLQQSAQDMEAQVTQLIDVYRITKETARALRVADLFALSLESASRLLAVQRLRLIDVSESVPQAFRAARAPEGSWTLPSIAPASVAEAEAATTTSTEKSPLFDVEEAIVRQARSMPPASETLVRELSWSSPEGAARFAWVPLRREQRVIGVFIAEDLPTERLKTLAMVGDQLSLQLSRVHFYGQVEALAVTDALTGLYVRSYFMERAQEELLRSQRHGLHCTLLMADLDMFKQKNDAFGHLVGDAILKETAQLLQRNLRDIDLIARFGGEEFVMLLVDTPIDQAMLIAERLRQLIEVHPIRAYDELVTQTISIGAAGCPDHAQQLDLLIDRADQALYAAKRAGRNRVVLWSAGT